MAHTFDDSDALVPQNLSDADSRVYEERTLEALRVAMIPSPDDALVIMDTIELVGSRPDTLVVFRYHHNPRYVGRSPGLEAGPRAELAGLWEHALDRDPYVPGLMESPGVLASAIGSAFDAAELDVVDPETLRRIGPAPKVYPRRYYRPPPPGWVP